MRKEKEKGRGLFFWRRKKAEQAPSVEKPPEKPLPPAEKAQEKPPALVIAEGKTLGESYGEPSMPAEEAVYPLQQWHNAVLAKTPRELTVPDLLRMIRQDVHRDLAVALAMDFLQEDPYVCEMWNADLLEHVSRVKAERILPYRETLLAVMKRAEEMIPTHEWDLEEDLEELKDTLHRLAEKLG